MFQQKNEQFNDSQMVFKISFKINYGRESAKENVYFTWECILQYLLFANYCFRLWLKSNFSQYQKLPDKSKGKGGCDTRAIYVVARVAEYKVGPSWPWSHIAGKLQKRYIQNTGIYRARWEQNKKRKIYNYRTIFRVSWLIFPFVSVRLVKDIRTCFWL